MEEDREKGQTIMVEDEREAKRSYVKSRSLKRVRAYRVSRRGVSLETEQN